jgi:hypothetical protein
MKINKHHHKWCNKEFNLNKKPLKLKHYPSLKNVVENMLLVKDGNVLDYMVIVDQTLAKLKCNWPYIPNGSPQP